MLKNKITKYDLFIFNNSKKIHALRIGVGFVACFVFFKNINIQSHSWPLISLLVVLAPTSFLGNVLPRARHRMYGTILGVLLGIPFMRMSQISNIISLVYIFILFLIIGWMTSTKYQYVAILMGITLSVICSVDPGRYDVAVWRGIDIIMGSCAAILVSLISPQKAEIKWRMNYHDIFILMRESLSYTLSKNSPANREAIRKYITNIRNKIEQNQKIYTPLSKEINTSVNNLKSIDNITLEIALNIEIIFNIIWSEKIKEPITLINDICNLNIKLTNCLSDLASYIKEPNEKKISMSIKELKDEMKLISKPGSKNMSSDDLFLFDLWVESNLTYLISGLEKYLLCISSGNAK